MIIAIDQSTSATKALAFDDSLALLARASVPHKQYYPQAGWVEHDPEEIYHNTLSAIRQVCDQCTAAPDAIAITNQRETLVVWDRATGLPVTNAIVWQDTRGTAMCNTMRATGAEPLIMERTGLKLDTNFPAPSLRWVLENAAQSRAHDTLCAGTIDCWLVWKLTHGKVFATDQTNASRTMLYNITTGDWDADMLRLFGVPRVILPEVRPCDAIYGDTTADGILPRPTPIAGVIGDSHGALVGQMCFRTGTAKVTYGTGSSVMANIGTTPQRPPRGLVTSVAFTAFGDTYYGFEGNIYSTGATIKWLTDQLRLLPSPRDAEAIARSVPNNGGVTLVPAFAGLGAPWWNSDVRAAITGLTFSTTQAHIVRAAVESIALQVADLVQAMRGFNIRTIAADGGPTANTLLMQLQADLLAADIITTDVDDASALGAAIMAGIATGRFRSFDDITALQRPAATYSPKPEHNEQVATLVHQWQRAIKQLVINK